MRLKFSDLLDDVELVDSGDDIIVKNFRFESEKKDIYLPYGITRLGDGCFSGTNIERIHLCGSIKQVGYGCFANCNKLQLITITEEQAVFIPDLHLSNNAEIKIRSSIRRHGDV